MSAQTPVTRDWQSRQFVETIQFNLLSLSTFLNNFDDSIKTKLANLNAKLNKLERYVDVLEAIVRDPEPVAEQAKSSELHVQVLYQGDGETIPNDGNEVIISYVAYLPDGEVVEAFPPESPLQYVIGSGSVISGLDFTVKTMSLGEQVRAVIPSEYAYGSEGVPGRVPKNTALVYDIYLAAVL